MKAQAGSARAAALVEDLRDAVAALISVLERAEPERWARTPGPSIWSIGKDAAHVAEATVYHQWIVRLTIGGAVPSRRPVMDRKALTTTMTPDQAVDLIRRRTDESATLISTLTDQQLDVPTRPPRARAEALGETIGRVLIGHYDVHRRDIERKLGDVHRDAAGRRQRG